MLPHPAQRDLWPRLAVRLANLGDELAIDERGRSAGCAHGERAVRLQNDAVRLAVALDACARVGPAHNAHVISDLIDGRDHLRGLEQAIERRRAKVADADRPRLSRFVEVLHRPPRLTDDLAVAIGGQCMSIRSTKVV